MFWLDLLKLGYDQKKALPSQPAQTWPPFTQVQITTEGRLFTTFPPQTSAKIFIK